MSRPLIHPTAIIDPKAELDTTVEVGPYAIIEADVRIGARTKIGPHVHIEGITEIGCDNRIGTGTTLGHAPQHLSYKGEPRRFTLGDRNVIREFVTMHRAFLDGEGTIVGNDTYFMSNSHVPHDCIVGNHVVVTNQGGFSGHCIVGDYVFASSLAMVHQFCRIGAHAFLAPNTKIDRDVPPFMIVEGLKARLRGINSKPLQSRGISSEAVEELKAFYRKVYQGEGTFRQRLEAFSRQGNETPEIRQILDFYADEDHFGDKKRGLTPGPVKSERR